MYKTATAIALIALACLGTGLPAASDTRDGAIIRNSGSSNFAGYVVTVWSDGTAQGYRSRAGRTVGNAVKGSISSQLATKFFNDLSTAKHNQIVAQSCMKSASFGSSMIVQYHRWTTPDLECPGDGSVIALASEAHQIAATLGLLQGSRRVPMLPNEKRRPVMEVTPPSGQASATPEPSPSAS